MSKKQPASTNYTSMWNDFWVAFLASIIGVIFTHSFLKWLNKEGDIPETIAVPESRVSHIEEQPTSQQPSNTKEREADDSGDKAEVPNLYLQLVAVIQGITVAVIGQSVVSHGLNTPLSWEIWVMIVASFVVALIYWLEFMMGYMYLYKVIRFTALGHSFVTAVYFLMGICQIVAFSLIHEPALWFLAIAILAALAAVYSTAIRRRSISTASQRPLATHIQHEHRQLARTRFLAAIVIGAIGWFVTVWPPIMIIFLALILVLLWDVIRDFQKRQQVLWKGA